VPKLPSAHRAAHALPLSVAAGTAPLVHAAATLTLRRLHGGPTLSRLSAAELRTEIARLYRENLSLGGDFVPPADFDLSDRPSLRRTAVDLRSANAALRAKSLPSQA